MRFSPLSLVTIVGLLPVVISTGGFSFSCEDISLSGSVLSALCFNVGGGLVSTSLDIDECIGNNNGALVCGL